MAIKQHSFKTNTSNPVEKEIQEFLQENPTQYHVIEALKIYVRMEKAKQRAVDKMIASVESRSLPQSSDQQPQAAPAAKDSIKDFEL